MPTRSERHQQASRRESNDRDPRKKKYKKKHPVRNTILFILGAAVLLVGALMAKVYMDVRGTADDLYEGAQSNSQYARKVDIGKKTKDNTYPPFSVLLLGVDTGDLGRVDQGRSDTMMVLTVNPETEKTTITSLQRDTYIMINGNYDKLNAAYAYGGASLAMETVENYLEIPIDYYISVNMMGFQELVGAIGGVDVQSDLTFSQQGYDFVKGENYHLEGERLLAYTRNRYDDPDGDYGRQNRQRQIISAAINKMKSVDTLSNYQSILSSLEGNVQTNLKFDQMQNILLNYRAAATQLDEKSLRGSGEMIGGVSYQIVSEEDRQAMSQMLKRELEIE
ncbi:MAG: LCP family glycopolymer transferase [Bavariicoccus seileri]|uniref:LCP family glycopolymer transferase n=1 Tax=Bavariicoccus seileri TaxID=549685 RepID=UPI003F94B5C9